MEYKGNALEFADFAHFLDFSKPSPQLPETVSPSSEGVEGRTTSKIMSPIRILFRGIVYIAVFFFNRTKKVSRFVPDL